MMVDVLGGLKYKFVPLLRVDMEKLETSQELCGMVDDVHHVKSRLWRDQ